jgi:hypothetical protein
MTGVKLRKFELQAGVGILLDDFIEPVFLKIRSQPDLVDIVKIFFHAGKVAVGFDSVQIAASVGIFPCNSLCL